MNELDREKQKERERDRDKNTDRDREKDKDQKRDKESVLKEFRQKFCEKYKRLFESLLHSVAQRCLPMDTALLTNTLAFPSELQILLSNSHTLVRCSSTNTNTGTSAHT